MTSTKLVQAEINRFLESDTPEVLCITGKWGVGKTYAWKHFVSLAQAKTAIALKRYSYVSLFGQNSLSELRSSIFEETNDVGQIGKPFDPFSPSSLISRGKTTAPWIFNHARKFIPWLKEAPDVTARWLFLAVRNQIVCFDDLERHGKGLETQDVLGLTSFLKEDRKCKVVLLLNEDALGDDEKTFQKLLEKVVDIRLEFNPTSSEAVEIGLTPNTPVYEYLRDNCKALGIVNIRVIRKIERLALDLANLLKGYDAALLKQAVHSVTLFGWSAFQPDDAPPLEFTKKYDRYLSLATKKDEGTDKEKAWGALLQDYQFTNVDEFDSAVLAGVQSGAFDPDILDDAAKPLAAKIDFQRRDNSFSEAWNFYHRSFNVGADEVLDKMANAFRAAVKTITPLNLSATISLFKDLGRPEQATELLQYYIEQRSDESPKLFDLGESVFGAEVKDPEVRTAFALKTNSITPKFDPKELLLRIGLKGGWHSKDLEQLAKVSPSEFKAIFKATEGSDLLAVIKAALEFGKFGNASDEMKTITANATSALREIAAESPINARRVAMYGISSDTSS